MTERNSNWNLLPYRSVWQHKHRPITAVVNKVLGDDVQVVTHDRRFLEWFAVRGFMRDCTNTGEFERVEMP